MVQPTELRTNSGAGNSKNASDTQGIRVKGGIMKHKSQSSRRRHVVLDQAIDGSGAVYSEYVTYLGNARWLLESIGDQAEMSDEHESADLISNLREADEYDNECCPLGQRLRSLLDAAKAEGDAKTVEELVKIDHAVIATGNGGVRGERPFVEIIAEIESVIAKALGANKSIPWKDLIKKTKGFRDMMRKPLASDYRQVGDILAGMNGVNVAKHSDVDPEYDPTSSEVAYWCVSADHARVGAALKACAAGLKKWAASGGL